MTDKRERIIGSIGTYPLEDIEKRDQHFLMLRKHIENQEKQLEEYQAKIKKEQLDRENAFQNEMEQRERLLAEREKKLRENQLKIDQELAVHHARLAAQKNNFEKENARRESEHQKALQDLKQLEIQYNDENRSKIENRSSGYVSATLEILERKEKEFLRISRVWGIVGASSLYLGLLFFVYVTSSSLFLMPSPMSWEFITFSAFKGLIAVGLFAALAKYSLLFSNLHMREALKNADRGHAINFGKFYLSIYGAAADWPQIKEAFEHWNIAGNNVFSNPKSEESNLDINSLEKLSNVIEKIGKIFPETKKEKSE
jgi:hypothetical protein